MPVTVTREGKVAVLRFANGAVNALSVGQGLVGDFARHFGELVADPTVAAIVVTGEGRMFCGGADIADFDAEDLPIDQARALVEGIERSPKPVVMAIHGMALGGGLELALAGHYRVAAPGTKLGLPEITLGLLPGAGGTQRLPRLIGAAAALKMILTGHPIPAERALDMGLVDRIADDPVNAAIAWAGELSGEPRRTGTLPAPADLDSAIGAVRAAGLPRGYGDAPDCILDCVAAVGTNLATGLAIEAKHFEALRDSVASRALRHAFFGERIVARIPGLPAGLSPRPFAKVGIVGGGLMGTGIALALLNAGLDVTIVESKPEALERAKASIAQTIARDVEKGRIAQAKADARIAAFTPAADLAALAEVDLVIEAVFEDMAVKQQVFTALDAVTRSDAILASNTSTLDLDRIAGFVRDPSRVVGLHFFSPANIMRLLEIVRGAATAPDVLVTALAFAKSLGKVGVVSGVCDGFIGNRMVEEYLRQVWFLIEEGALPQQIDRALENWGMAMGPCRMMDLAGQDIGWAIRKRRAAEQPDRPYSQVIDRICEQGRFGQKTGAGIYLYADGRTPVPDPTIDAMIVAFSAEIGVERRAISDEEIVERCLLALINEGAKIVEEGIAYRPVDVDMVYLHGYGFGRHLGGPMFQADAIGLPRILGKLRHFAAGRHGWAFTPAPLIEQLAQSDGCFADLNG